MQHKKGSETLVGDKIIDPEESSYDRCNHGMLCDFFGWFA